MAYPDNKTILRDVLKLLISDHDKKAHIYNTEYMHTVYADNRYCQDSDSFWIGIDKTKDVSKYPMPACCKLEHVTASYSFIGANVTSYKKALKINKWLLKVSGRHSETHTFSMIGPYLQGWGYISDDAVYHIPQYYGCAIVESDILENLNQIADAHDVYYGIFAKKIQRAYRKHLLRIKSAKIIQREWRRVVSNPNNDICKRALLWSFYNLSEI